MKFVLLFILSITQTIAGSYSSQAQPGQGYLHALYDSLTHPILEGERISSLSNVSIIRGGQKVVFKSGTIRFFAPVKGKRFGCVFTGSGKYIISPPTEVERL